MESEKEFQDKEYQSHFEDMTYFEGGEPLDEKYIQEHNLNFTMADAKEYIQRGESVPFELMPDFEEFPDEIDKRKEFMRQQEEALNRTPDDILNNCDPEDLDRPEDFEPNEYDRYILEETRKKREMLGIKLPTSVDELPDI